MVADAILAGHEDHRRRAYLARVHAVMASAAREMAPAVFPYSLCGGVLDRPDTVLIKFDRWGIRIQRHPVAHALAVLLGNTCEGRINLLYDSRNDGILRVPHVQRKRHLGSDGICRRRCRYFEDAR